jgi:hypothetical protein
MTPGAAAMWSPFPYGDESSSEAASVDDMYIYPAQGQSEQQQADDKYQCHRWAVDQTQYDPTSSISMRSAARITCAP